MIGIGGSRWRRVGDHLGVTSSINAGSSGMRGGIHRGLRLEDGGRSRASSWVRGWRVRNHCRGGDDDWNCHSNALQRLRLVPPEGAECVDECRQTALRSMGSADVPLAAGGGNTF